MPRELHPAGNFDATILDHGFSEAKTGTMQFWSQFETESGIITGFFPLTDKAAEGSLQKIAAMGYRGTNLPELADGTMLRSMRCSITVRHESYQGEMRDRVAWVNPEGYVPGPKRDETTAANAAKFNGLLAKIQENRQDDVPF